MQLFIRRAVSALLTLAVMASVAYAQPEVPSQVRDEIARAGTARVIVGVNHQVADLAAAFATEAALTAERAAIRSSVDSVLNQVPDGLTVGKRYQNLPFFAAEIDADGLAALAKLPEVTSIEYDVIDRPYLSESVPLIGAPTSWAAGFTGTGWSVGILDTGVQTNHPMVAGRVLAEGCFSTTSAANSSTSVCPGGVGGVTGPGTGINCNPAVSGCDHGTHVAGIVAGNSATLRGVAPGAGLLAVQVFSQFTGANCGSGPSPCVLTYTSDQIAGMDFVLSAAGAGNVNRIAAINMSLGGGRFFTAAACDSANVTRKAAVDRLAAVGIASAIASGNDGFTDSMGAPGCISTAISVGSTTKSDVVSSFSNRSNWLQLMAPGSSINSSVTGSVTGVKSGTSMATPHVAGAWAVLKQAAPTATVAQVLNALRTTGTAINDPLSDFESAQAIYPRINVNAARVALVGGGGSGAPGQPGQPNVVVNGNLVTLTIVPPTTGGAPAAYFISAGVTPGGSELVANLNVGLTTTLGPVSLPNGTYYLRVVAANAAGQSPVSPERQFSVGPTGGVPGTPGISATAVGSTLNVAITAATSGGTPSFYVIIAGTTPGGSQLGSHNIGLANAVSATLPPGTYYLRVYAVNAFGNSPVSSEASATIAGPSPPGVPNLAQPTVVGNQVTVSWSPGSGGTPDVYDLEATVQATGQVIPLTLPGSLTSQTFTGIPQGNFLVRIRARNAQGTSAYSPSRLIVVGFTLGGGHIQATLSWNSTADIDLHVIEPDGTHVYFGNANPGRTARLDRDDTDGFGPENIFVTTAATGTYQFFIVHWAGPATQSTIRIQLRNPDGTFQAPVFVRSTTTPNSTVGFNVANVNHGTSTIVETTGTRVADERADDAVLFKPTVKQ